MRSTTSTERSRPRGAAALVAATLCALLAPVSASAAEARCFARDYDAAHLAAHPAQVVRAIRLALPADPLREGLRIAVTFAAQGHAGAAGLGGATMTQDLICLPGGRPLRCAVECDGGLLTVTRLDKGILEFTTDYLLVGDTGEFGGVADLAEVPGQPVSYRVFAAPLTDCEGF